MNVTRYTESQILCGLPVAVPGLTGVEDPLTRIDTFLKAYDAWDDVDFIDIFARLNGFSVSSVARRSGRICLASMLPSAAWTNGAIRGSEFDLRCTCSIHRGPCAGRRNLRTDYGVWPPFALLPECSRESAALLEKRLASVCSFHRVRESLT